MTRDNIFKQIKITFDQIAKLHKLKNDNKNLSSAYREEIKRQGHKLKKLSEELKTTKL